MGTVFMRGQTYKDTSSVTAAQSDVRTGKVFVNANASSITGNRSEKAAATYRASTSDQTIASGSITTGNQVLAAVTLSNISAGNIKKGTTITVYNGSSNLANVAGTYTEITASAAAAGDILTGKVAFVNGSQLTGTLASAAGGTYSVNNTSAQTVFAANKYASSNIVVNGISNLAAGNIRSGITVCGVKGTW